MEIKVLGSGCKKCKKLLDNVKQAVKELNIKADIDYVTDIVEIANSGLMRTPGLIIDKRIISSGDVSNIQEIKAIISGMDKKKYSEMSE